MKSGIGPLLASAWIASTQWIDLSAAQNYTYTDEQQQNAKRNLSIGFVSDLAFPLFIKDTKMLSQPTQVIYPGFQLLDVFGPLELLFDISYTYNLSLSLIANATGPVHSRPPSHASPDGMTMDLSSMLDTQVSATHTFSTAPPLDVLVVPGGLGYLTLVADNTRQVETFIASRLASTPHVLSVCTGAALLARAGGLDDRRATTNKAAWADVVRFGTNVTWVPSARWVRDGKVWTSSGVSAGMDMMVAFLRYMYGDPEVNRAVNVIEYAPHVDPDWDPFSVVHKVPGANMSRSLVDTVSPLEEYPDPMGGMM